MPNPKEQELADARGSAAAHESKSAHYKSHLSGTYIVLRNLERRVENIKKNEIGKKDPIDVDDILKSIKAQMITLQSVCEMPTPEDEEPDPVTGGATGQTALPNGAGGDVTGNAGTSVDAVNGNGPNAAAGTPGTSL